MLHTFIVLTFSIKHKFVCNILFLFGDIKQTYQHNNTVKCLGQNIFFFIINEVDVDKQLRSHTEVDGTALLDRLIFAQNGFLDVIVASDMM